MRALIQRVTSAQVAVDSRTVAKIGPGLVVLAGIAHDDGDADVDWLAGKIIRLRVFDDADGVMNLSLVDIGGDLLIVSQFTLHASTRKGNRPSYAAAARPELAEPLVEALAVRCEALLGKPVGRGVFGAHMSVELTNDGPVTILIDSAVKE